MITPLALPFPPGFHYEHTVYSHGWCALLPFTLHRTTQLLRCPVEVGPARVAELRFSLPSQRTPMVIAESKGALSVRKQQQLIKTAADILHLGLDLRPFYKRLRNDVRFSWMASRRTGRMLRSPSFFEDAAKMLLTTNCSWSLTETMTARLCEHFGEVSPFGGHCFPHPEAIADSTEAFLRREVKLGYRSPYLLEFAKRVAKRELQIEEFRSSTLTAAELYRELRGIKGIGEYAASNLLKLLGRFDFLGLDSWCRAKYSEIYRSGGTVSDAEIEAFYAPYENWKGLVMWLDVTQHWYSEKFPF